MNNSRLYLAALIATVAATIPGFTLAVAPTPEPVAGFEGDPLGTPTRQHQHKANLAFPFDVSVTTYQDGTLDLYIGTPEPMDLANQGIIHHNHIVDIARITLLEVHGDKDAVSLNVFKVTAEQGTKDAAHVLALHEAWKARDLAVC